MEKKMALSKKVRTMLAFGALPSTSVAALGDFLSPKGGWLLPVLLGGLALLVVGFLLLLGTGKAKSVTDGDEEMEGWWDGDPRAVQLGVRVLFIFGVCGIAFGLLSRTKAAEGGVLSTNFTVVAEAQQIVGLMKQSVALQTRTAEATEAIRDTVKRETSDDPRKELANTQQPWSEEGMAAAIERNDVTSVELYARGGMQAGRGSIHNLFRPTILDPKMASILMRQGTQADLESCVQDSGSGTVHVPAEMTNFQLMTQVTGGPELDYVRDDVPVGKLLQADRVEFWAALCGGSTEVADVLRKRVAWWEGVQGGRQAKEYYRSLIDRLADADLRDP